MEMLQLIAEKKTNENNKRHKKVCILSLNINLSTCTKIPND